MATQEESTVEASPIICAWCEEEITDAGGYYDEESYDPVCEECITESVTGITCEACGRAVTGIEDWANYTADCFRSYSYWCLECWASQPGMPSPKEKAEEQRMLQEFTEDADRTTQEGRIAWARAYPHAMGAPVADVEGAEIEVGLAALMEEVGALAKAFNIQRREKEIGVVTRSQASYPNFHFIRARSLLERLYLKYSKETKAAMYAGSAARDARKVRDEEAEALYEK